KNGLNNINTGRSILYERTLEIIRTCLIQRAKVVIWENVPNLISKRHKHHFNHYIQCMEEMGYTNSHAILNPKDFGTPHSRDRLYVVSFLGNQKYKFPEPIKNIK
ncbi:MAG: DNA cytosine methyltransferase, partial [Coprobacillaceae bacterium]